MLIFYSDDYDYISPILHHHGEARIDETKARGFSHMIFSKINKHSVRCGSYQHLTMDFPNKLIF